MGTLFAKLWGKTSTKDLLEKISSQLGDIETFNRDTQAWYKKLIGYLLAYFAVLYFLAIIIVYYNYYYDREWQDFRSRLRLLTPFLVAPLIIFFLKRFLTWWYHRKLRKNETQLAKLKEKRAKILEDVMETETYKVAKELLDKYGPLEQPPKQNTSKSLPMGKGLKVGGVSSQLGSGRQSSLQLQSQEGSTLRQRRSTTQLPGSNINTESNTNSPSGSHPGSPFRALPSSEGGSRSPIASDSKGSLHSPQQGLQQRLLSQQGIQRRAPGPPLPRPILPRERGYMDRAVEYLVGDGPSNRYALICKQCQSHNGMALREEFEYIAYRCCYCFYWNPARKQRPVAPKLQPAITRPSSTETSSEDDDDTAQNPSIEQKEAAAKPEEKEQEHHSTEVTEVEEPTDSFSGEEKQETEPESELLLGNLTENNQDVRALPEHSDDESDLKEPHDADTNAQAAETCEDEKMDVT